MAPLDVEESRGLTAQQLDAIADLEGRVVAHDGGRLKLEWGVLRERPPDAVSDVLAWDGAALVGFLGIYAFGSEPELAGAVDPGYRRRGLGSVLLARGRELLGRSSHATALLVTPRATESGRRFAEVKGATFAHAEHHMELDCLQARSPAPRPSTRGLAIRQATVFDRAPVGVLMEDAFGGAAAAASSTGPHDLAFVAERGGTVVGAFRLDVDGQVAGVYGLTVRADLRGQGIGRAVLYQVSLEARRRGLTTVTLEVDLDNEHALGLYTSVGFQLRTTEDYFRLAV